MNVFCDVITCLVYIMLGTALRQELRISGGVHTNISSVPYITSVRFDNFHLCAGIIVHDHHIITAAHCIYGKRKERLSVEAGTSWLGRGGEIFLVSKIYIHEKFCVPSELNNDIAMLILNRKIRYSSSMFPPKPPPWNGQPPENSIFAVSGWGITEDNSTLSVRLKTALIPEVDPEVCAVLYPIPITASMMCAGGQGIGPCLSDSGGPLTLRNEKEHYLVGMVSFGQGLCPSLYPAVFVKMVAMKGWVTEKVTLPVTDQNITYTSAKSVPIDDEDKIVGGEEIDIELRPFQVSLRKSKNNFHFCGGSILNHLTVLTAAHCLPPIVVEEDIIVAGSSSLSKGGDVYTILVKTQHVDYGKETRFDSDVAILLPDKSIVFSKSVSPIKLASKNMDFPDGFEMLVSGWGKTESGSASNILKQAKAKYVKGLTEVFGEKITKNMIAAKKIGETACSGDSGGPLTSADNELLIGVVSFGEKACSGNYPAIYARVSALRDWIDENIVTDDYRDII